MNFKFKRGESGQALLMAMIFLIVFTVMGFGLLVVFQMDTYTSRNLKLAEDSLNTAEEGILVGMAFAADKVNVAWTASASPGDSICLNSIDQAGKSKLYTENRYHYQVKVIRGGLTQSPGGETKSVSGTGASTTQWVSVTVQSVGMVVEDSKDLFSFSHKPPVQRKIQVVGRVPVN